MTRRASRPWPTADDAAHRLADAQEAQGLVVNGLRYLTRWRIEETIRFTKQSYDLEDIRVMTYDRLHNMVALVNDAAFFTAVVLGRRVKLHVLASHLITAAKRLFDVPNFRYYALADGIAEICAKCPQRPPASATDPPQPSLALP